VNIYREAPTVAERERIYRAPNCLRRREEEEEEEPVWKKEGRVSEVVKTGAEYPRPPDPQHPWSNMYN